MVNRVTYKALAVSEPAEEGRGREGGWSEEEAFIDASKSKHDPCDHGPKKDEEDIDERLKDYPVPLVAQTVDLNNDETEPMLTFRFWILSTIWVIVGCTVSSVHYFKPYLLRLSPYVVILCSWAMGKAMAKYLPCREIKLFGRSWNLNPGPFNAKEHSLVAVAYWGSNYTAYGLGPLSAMELYCGKRLAPLWSILFLMATQMVGYGLAGLYREFLMGPPELFYPGVLPSVALFKSMHGKGEERLTTMLRFFAIVTLAAFAYQWLPSFVWPMLSSIPILCYLGAGNWKAFVLGSGTYGFGILDLSFDWNYASFFQPLYTPLSANLNRFAGAILACWILYPIAYFFNTFDTLKYPPMSSGTWDEAGGKFNITAIAPTALDRRHAMARSLASPQWSFSYATHFFWGFASAGAVVAYALLFHGGSLWNVLKRLFTKEHWPHSKDPYIRLTAHLPQVPRLWYLILLLGCIFFGIIQLYVGEMQVPWWGLLLITAIAAAFAVPSGLVLGLTNVQVGMDYIAELLAGYLFPGKPVAVLTCTVYGRQILEQCLNMTSDMKFAFYMKVPERQVFIAQIYGTVLGPLVNWICMRLILDNFSLELKGDVPSTTWNAVRTRNFYSLSVIWGLLGPKIFLGPESDYWWLSLGFLVGALAVCLVWLLHRSKPHWKLEERLNPAIIFSGAAVFPVYTTTNLMTSMIVAVMFMGYIYRYHSGWFRKYNYILGAGLDCGTQMTEVLLLLFVTAFSGPDGIPHWWGNNAGAVD